MEKKFKISVKGVEQNGVFDSYQVARLLLEWAESVGGEFQVKEYVPPEPSNEFKVGVEYYCRSMYDHDCVYRLKVVKRTEKSVWVESNMWNKRCVVKKDEQGCEYFMPDHYSFAPVFRANKVADGVHDLSSWGVC